EHSHESILSAVRTTLNLNNPDGIVDPVFALLGNAAAKQGLGKITDPDCLQQAVADQAFTNAKAAGDVNAQVNALIFRALERNSGSVGAASAACTSIKAVNPEIAAIQQHQDPASSGAAATNKAVVLELAKQIASVGGDPQLALKSGTFAPGTIGDPTAKGNSCDDANDAQGCIFTQNLLVDDATAAEISAAVAGVSTASGSSSSSGSNNAGSSDASTAAATSCAPAATVTVTATAAATPASGANNAAATASSAAAASTAAAAGGNLQTFTGKLGGSLPPAVTAGGRGFVVAGSDDFLNIGAALQRSCDIQHNACANSANSAAGRSSGLTVSQCDQQDTQCTAAGKR
ncbi:hypothetical protein HETIRDRAFT_384154, partial [Heterobasidion irregulare TC 32-1]